MILEFKYSRTHIKRGGSFGTKIDTCDSCWSTSPAFSPYLRSSASSKDGIVYRLSFFYLVVLIQIHEEFTQTYSTRIHWKIQTNSHFKISQRRLLWSNTYIYIISQLHNSKHALPNQYLNLNQNNKVLPASTSNRVSGANLTCEYVTDCFLNTRQEHFRFRIARKYG